MTLTDHLQSGIVKLIGAFLRRFSLRRVQAWATAVGGFFYNYIPVRRKVCARKPEALFS